MKEVEIERLVYKGDCQMNQKLLQSLHKQRQQIEQQRNLLMNSIETVNELRLTLTAQFDSLQQQDLEIMKEILKIQQEIEIERLT